MNLFYYHFNIITVVDIRFRNVAFTFNVLITS